MSASESLAFVSITLGAFKLTLAAALPSIVGASRRRLLDRFSVTLFSKRMTSAALSVARLKPATLILSAETLAKPNWDVGKAFPETSPAVNPLPAVWLRSSTHF